MNKNFWCKDEKSTADYVLEKFPHEVSQTKRLADDICANIFTFREHWEMERTNIPVEFKDKIDWEYKPSNDPEWTYAFNRHTCFVILAKTWLYTHDDKYALHFARIAESWIDSAKLTEQTKNGSWRSLEAGLRCETWLRAMDIFKNCSALPAELFNKMDLSLREHAEFLKATSADFHVLSNWGVLQDHGLFLLGLYFNEIDYCKLAVSRLENNLNIQFFRDGTHWEQSPMYHCEVLHCFLDVVIAARSRSYSLPNGFEEKVENACRGLALWIKPNGVMPMQGDSDDINARDLVACGAYLFNSGELKAYAAGEYFEENLWDFGVEFVEKYNKIVTINPKTPSVALPDSGNYFLRSDNTQDAVWLQFHCGCLGSGHGHADQLSVNLAAFGEDILIDTGRFTYVDCPIRHTLKAARAHNTTLCDGEEFSQQLDSWGYKTLANPMKGEYTFTEHANYVTGLHFGYFNRGVIARRRVMHIMPDIYIISDTFYAHGEHGYEQLFHFGKGEVSLSGNTASFKGSKTFTEIIALGNVTSTLEKHPCSYEYNLLSECDALSVRASAEGTFNFVTVISVNKSDSAEKTKAELLPVNARRKGIVLPFEKACGVKIVKGAKEYTALLCHEELISEVELLEVNGHCGYGKAVLFGDGLNKTGLCLEW